MAVSVVSFSFSRAAQPEAQGPNSLLDDGFLYCILSPTSLDPNSSGAQGPFGLAWLSLPHLVSITPTLTVWLLVLTELYNSSTSTQSPTQSLEWHVWSSSSGNNCHAVHRSLSSGASVYECTMGFFFFTLSHFIRQIPPTRFLSITGHWDVSLLSGASLWDGIFARVEGQNTTFTPLEFFTSVLADGFFYRSLSDSKSPQVSRTYLRILAVLCYAVVWIVSTRPPTSKSSRPFNNPLVIVPRTPITIGTIVTFMFHSFFNSLARSRYLSFFSLSFRLIIIIITIIIITSSLKPYDYVQTNDYC